MFVIIVVFLFEKKNFVSLFYLTPGVVSKLKHSYIHSSIQLHWLLSSGKVFAERIKYFGEGFFFN